MTYRKKTTKETRRIGEPTASADFRYSPITTFVVQGPPKVSDSKKVKETKRKEKSTHHHHSLILFNFINSNTPSWPNRPDTSTQSLYQLFRHSPMP